MITELSDRFSVKYLCDEMEINRSGYYKWLKRQGEPSMKTRTLISNVMLFKEYHVRYPSHGYRWLNAKIRLDTGQVMSDPYAYKCCRIAGIKSRAKKIRYKHREEKEARFYPNLSMSEIYVDGPLQCVVSDMTAFYVNGVYYELTLYMDLWNNEILTHSLSEKRGDRMTYISGLNDLLELKDMYPGLITVLHSDRGSVYSSKVFNERLEYHNIIRSMSRPGKPTDNGAMEAVNGWMKAEMFMDLHIKGKNVYKEVDDYIHFFNTERPAYSLNYMTPVQYRELYGGMSTFCK